AVYGFAVFLLKLARIGPGDALAVAFDPPGPTFRHKAFEAYKEQRKPMPPDLVSQLPLLRELVDAFGAPRFEIEGFEADDVLATLAARARRDGRGVVIHSGDKDILQLVEPGVAVSVPRKGEEELMDDAAVRRRWGVAPGSIADLLALMGDASDNLPGVDGVGEKTAAALLGQFASLDGLFRGLAQVKSEKLRGKLRDAEAQVRATRALAALRCDVPLPPEAAAPCPPAPDAARLRALFTELDFTRLLASLPAASPGAGGTVAVRVERADDALREALSRAPLLRCAALPEGVAVEVEGGRWFLPAGSPALADLRAIWEAPGRTKTVLAGKPLARILAGAGCGLAGVGMDVELAVGLLRERVPLQPAEGGPEERASLALDVSEREAAALEARVRETGQWDLLTRIELPVTPVLAAMEARGIRLDAGQLATVAEELRGRLAVLEEELARGAGAAFNVLSPKQVAEVLFTTLKLPAKRKTKTGYSTDETVLEELALLHPVPAAILEYRKLAKLLGTYLEPLPGYCGPDGLLHTTYHQLGAATGRISSSDPNLQNVPVRGEIGQRIRAAFVPRAPDRVLLSADYAQIELRLLAHIADDEAFKEAFRTGVDVHAVTAGEMFGKPPSAVSPDERRAAKAVNFGIVYG
ncbi:MAG: DNA polymerase, partial [bacterium]